MTFLFCGELAELDVVRQNGEAEEDRSTWTISCCCFLEAMSEQVNACPVSRGGPAMNPSFRWLYRASTKKLDSFRSYLTPS